MILIDGEAGIEQIKRRVIYKVDMPLIVTDATIRGLRTAVLIKDMAKKDETNWAKNIGLMINRVREGQKEQLKTAAEQAGLKIIRFFPEDDCITQFDLAGKPIYDLEDRSPSLAAMKDIAKNLGLLA